MAGRKKALIKSRWLIKNMYDRYNEHEIPQISGQLAYFFLLSIFPFLILVNALIAQFNISPLALQKALDPFMHNDITDVIVKYVTYISEHQNITLLSVGVVAQLFSASKAVRALGAAMNKAYGVKGRSNIYLNFLTSMLFMFFLGIIILLAVLIITAGQSLFMSKLPDVLQISSYTISVSRLLLWLLFIVILFIILLLVFTFVPNIKLKLKNHLPGVIFSLTGNLFLSFLFSTYFNNSLRISALFGTITSVLLLMFWMYFAGQILILGAELNSSLIDLNRKH